MADLTPLQWLTRLSQQIADRAPLLDLWDRYYDGDHDLPVGPAQHTDAFRRFQAKARMNLCAMPVDSVVDRLRVNGITDGSESAELDPTLFSWWQKNRMDARQSTLYRYALRHGVSFLIVGAHPSKPKVPRWTIESARSVAVAVDPADPMVRRAAARLWSDPLTQKWHATLWLPGARFSYQMKASVHSGMEVPTGASAWEQVGSAVKSPKSIPVIPFSNGDELTDGVAEFAKGIDIQDRLNLSILNRLSAERYAAYRQRWVSNLDIEEDEDGNAIQPFIPGVTELWVAGQPEIGGNEVKFGDFAQTDTTQMLLGVSSDIKAFMAVTGTPVYYMPGDLTNIGADTIAALDAGHLSKCRQRQALWGEAYEEALGVSAEIVGVEGDLSFSEVQWERPENWHPTQVADLVTKQVGAGVPLPVVMEDMGKSPQYVTRLRQEMAAEGMRRVIGGRAAAP